MRSDNKRTEPETAKISGFCHYAGLFVALFNEDFVMAEKQ